MPKCHAPCPVSYRGEPLAIAPDGTCDLDDAQLAELAAHGVRRCENAAPEAPARRATDTDTNVRPQREYGATEPPLSETAQIDPSTAPREVLIQALKGKTRENLRFMKIDALRALAAKLLPNATKNIADAAQNPVETAAWPPVI